MENEENKNINKEKEENKLINNNSFSDDFSGIVGKDLFKEEQPTEIGLNKLKETVLDLKINEKIKETENKISPFIQSEQINELEKSLNISLTDENKEKKEYLVLRTFPEFDINEYDTIRKQAGKNLLDITNFLLNKKLAINLSEIKPHKKIGPLLPLTTLIESNYKYKPEYQNEMQKKYLRLKNYICNYRTIYGDGNCFYRAVMFKYIELLILNKQKDFLKILIIDINKCYSNPEAKLRLLFNNQQINHELIIQIMIIIYELVENNNILQAHQAFYKAILCSKDFDFLLCFYLKFILYEYIKNNEKKLYMKDFPVLIGNLLPANYENDGVFDFNSFYTNYLLKMFVPAEKIIVYLTPFVLGINLDVILFDDNEDNVIKHFQYCDVNGDNENKYFDIKQNIFLINRKCHYEAAFNFFDNKNFNDIYVYYRNDLKPRYIIEDPNLSNIYTKIKNVRTSISNKDGIIKQNDCNKNNINNTINNNINNIQNNNLNKNINNTHNNNINYIKNNNNNHNNINNNINNTHNTNVFNYTKNNNISTNNNINQQKNDKICIICSSVIYFKNKTIHNICQPCLFKESASQIKQYYKAYISLMINKINKITKDDLYNSFLNKIQVNIFEKTLNINQMIEEMEFRNNNVSYINKLMTYLKQNICLYCHKDINKSNLVPKYQLPCGCNFCSTQHLEYFFKNIVKNELTYNYKCICAIEYKPYQVMELCSFLSKNKIYDSYDKFIKHLSQIFKQFCCKCGKIKTTLYPVSIDKTISSFHNICEDCNQKNFNDINKVLYCLICNQKHILN